MTGILFQSKYDDENVSVILPKEKPEIEESLLQIYVKIRFRSSVSKTKNATFYRTKKKDTA